MCGLESSGVNVNQACLGVLCVRWFPASQLVFLMGLTEFTKSTQVESGQVPVSESSWADLVTFESYAWTYWFLMAYVNMKLKWIFFFFNAFYEYE